MSDEGSLETPLLYDAHGDAVELSLEPERSTIGTPWFALILSLCVGVAASLAGYQAGKPPAVKWSNFQIQDATVLVSGSSGEDQNGWNPPELIPPPGHPPLSIIVGSAAYTVHYTTAAYLLKHNCGGFTRFEQHDIWLGRDLDSPIELRHVLLHELMHAAMNAGRHSEYQRRWEPPTTDDDFIETTSPALLGILRDNPKLVKWIQESPDAK